MDIYSTLCFIKQYDFILLLSWVGFQNCPAVFQWDNLLPILTSDCMSDPVSPRSPQQSGLSHVFLKV